MNQGKERETLTLQKLRIFLLGVILATGISIAPFATAAPAAKEEKELVLQNIIYGKIAPKSVAYSGNGLFFAQNMMYGHSVTVYNRHYQLVKTIQDQVSLADFGYPQYTGLYRGAPVEATFTHNGRYAWITNYQMYGPGFNNPGSDNCDPSLNYDNSFIYASIPKRCR